ncbi:uncharacterized protein [Dermacentor albipictus]|uniref:uncharacterized protein n=1 Tax=Dermacentor albipictus TaxID=60249 RepID=UPI0031FD0692
MRGLRDNEVRQNNVLRGGLGPAFHTSSALRHSKRTWRTVRLSPHRQQVGGSFPVSRKLAVTGAGRPDITCGLQRRARGLSPHSARLGRAKPLRKGPADADGQSWCTGATCDTGLRSHRNERNGHLQGPTEESHDWTLPPDSSVYVRNYGQGEKWIPGHVKSATGARMVTVETPTAIVKRHGDQVRRRSDSSPRFPDTTARSPGSNQTPGPSTATNATTSLEAAAHVNSLDAGQIADDSIRPHTPSLPTSLSPAEASQQVLRRSTRQRKPVQRFHF